MLSLRPNLEKNRAFVLKAEGRGKSKKRKREQPVRCCLVSKKREQPVRCCLVSKKREQPVSGPSP
jgi:hypothetical protein